MGERLAKAARFVAYGDARFGGVAGLTGPTVASCAIDAQRGALSLTFRGVKRDDALAARRASLAAVMPLAQLDDAAIAALARANPYGSGADYLFTSPLEVQYGGTGLTDGLWLSAVIHPQCADGGLSDAPRGARGNTL